MPVKCEEYKIPKPFACYRAWKPTHTLFLRTSYFNVENVYDSINLYKYFSWFYLTVITYSLFQMKYYNFNLN